MNTAIDKHIEHNYFVKVTGLKEVDGCKVEYPKNLFNDVNYGKYLYHLVDDGLEVYFNENDNTRVERYVIPKYARRIFILSDIILKCNHYDLSSSLIVFYDTSGNRKNKISEIVGNYEPDVKEKKLMSAFADIVSGKNTDLKYADVKKGVRCIADLFKEGGVK